MGREIHRPERSSGRNTERTSAAVRIGTVAAVFLIIIYEVALFVREAAVSRIAAHRDRPDTVYVFPAAPDTTAALRVADDGPVRAFANMPELGQGQSDTQPELQARRGSEDGLSSAFSPSAAQVRRNAEHGEVARRIYEAARGRRVENFRFDPNTVSVSDLQRLGFSEKQAAAIDNDRAKGGRFRKPEDFARSYVVADSVYRRLEPYIDIPKLDINKADSAAFDALPGIGPYYAAKMVTYRKSLHGYSYPEQLLDIPNFGSERYDTLKDLITVGPYEPYPIWDMPEDSLALHPYIGRYAAHGIIIYKESTPPEKRSVQDLKTRGILAPETADKLLRCRLR